MRTVYRRCTELPQTTHYVLQDANVPLACIEGPEVGSFEPDEDQVVNVDIVVKSGIITAINPRRIVNGKSPGAVSAPVNLRGAMVWPTFVDLHTHIGEPAGGISHWTL